MRIQVRTFREQGFVARSCGAGPISLNTSCVRASAAFNALETSAPVYKFPPLDPQVCVCVYIYIHIHILVWAVCIYM